jgi:hypothetical protein
MTGVRGRRRGEGGGEGGGRGGGKGGGERMKPKRSSERYAQY